MKKINRLSITGLVLASILCISGNAHAALTSQGSHPELLGNATCSGGVTGSYALYGDRFGISIKDSAQIGYHSADITPKKLGTAGIVYIESAPGASVNGFGSDGMSLYDYNGKTYFVGPYYNTRTAYFEFQICSINIATPPPPPTGPTYIGNSSQDQNVSCPPDRPSGYIVQRQNFEVWTDGNRNYSNWYNVADYCSVAYDHTMTEDRDTACPAGQLGTIVQRHTYEVWSDGSKRNFTPYKLISSTCSYPPFVVNPTTRVEACPIAHTGKIQYKWVVYYTDEPTNVVDADGQTVSIIVTTPHQREVLDFNSCKEIPTQTLQVKDRISTLSCDEYYGVSGIYLGTVTRVYRDTTIYSSITQSSTTTSVLINQDAASCQLDPKLEYSFDQNTKPCPVGQTGTMSGTRLVATDTSGKKTYPQGMDYLYTNNNCVGPAVAEQPKTPEPAVPLTVIENLFLTSSKLSSTDETSRVMNTWSKFKISDVNNRIDLYIDDLSAGKYNKANVSNVLKAYSKISGSQSRYNITLPVELEKYVGNGNLKDVKNKMFMNSKLDSNKNVILTYADSTGKSKLEPAEVITTTFPIFDSEAAKSIK